MDPNLECAENVVTMAYLGSGSKSIIEMLFKSTRIWAGDNKVGILNSYVIFKCELM